MYKQRVLVVYSHRDLQILIPDYETTASVEGEELITLLYDGDHYEVAQKVGTMLSVRERQCHFLYMS